jgi:acetyl-CoA carboxylase biotin carboxylase subunit
MRVVRSDGEVAEAFAIASAEAGAAFHNRELYLERYLENPRHVEVQVLGDAHGNLIHLGTRDCSLQRRHQKILEEGPAPGLPAALLDEIARLAVKGCQAIGYSNAGTLEFLVDPATHTFYFIEMNTRIQVEHPVSELITGVDLVAWQLRVAAGERLTLDQKAIRIQGHAIECRLNAEDAARGFLPQAGRVDFYLPPGGIGVRVDSHLYSGYTAPAYYDSLLGKVIVWDVNRDAVISRMKRALTELHVDGVKTTRALHLALLDDPGVAAGVYETSYLEANIERIIHAIA